MYIRAEAILPIGDALVSKGMGIGSVIARLIGGAGASIPEAVLLSKFFKKKLETIIVSSILIVAISTGFIVQIYLYRRLLILKNRSNGLNSYSRSQQRHV